MFEAWRSNGEKMVLCDRSIGCFKKPLIDMSADEINDSMSHFVFEVKNRTARNILVARCMVWFVA